MSLTTELRDRHSDLARWCAENLGGTASVVREVRDAVADVSPVRPRVRGALGIRHWAEIGGAWGQRVADLVQPAPPYYALLGMVRAGWVSATWAHEQAALYPTHRGLPSGYRARALDIRPVATGWLDVTSGLVGVSRPMMGAAEVWQGVLHDRRLMGVPTGAFGVADAEALLARTAWLLSACEDVYRSGELDQRLAQCFDPAARQRTAAQLRALVDGDQVAELGGLAARMEQSGTLARMRALAGEPRRGQPLGIAAPTIVPGWADGDVLLGALDPENGTEPAGGTTLIDLKTVVSLRDDERIALWLRQILGYAWLDTADLYRIRQVGLLLARHGVLLTWPVEELAARLMGGADPRQLARREFCAVAGRIIRSAGGVFPIVG